MDGIDNLMAWDKIIAVVLRQLLGRRQDASRDDAKMLSPELSLHKNQTINFGTPPRSEFISKFSKTVMNAYGDMQFESLTYDAGGKLHLFIGYM